MKDIDTDKISRISKIIDRSKDGEAIYIWIKTYNPEGFSDEQKEKVKTFENGYYAILGKVSSESYALTMRVDGIQYVSSPLTIARDISGNYKGDVLREEGKMVNTRSSKYGILTNEIVNYKLLSEDEYKIWVNRLLGTVDDSSPKNTVGSRLEKIAEEVSLS